MENTTLDLKLLLESLEPASPAVRFETIETTDTPYICIVHCRIKPQTETPTPELVLGIFARWNPEWEMLTMWIDLDLGPENESGDRLAVLVDQANLLNAELESRITRTSVYTNEDDDRNVVTITFSQHAPLITRSPEGMQWLRALLNASVVRLIYEATGTSAELHDALENAGIPVPNGREHRLN